MYANATADHKFQYNATHNTIQYNTQHTKYYYLYLNTCDHCVLNHLLYKPICTLSIDSREETQTYSLKCNNNVQHGLYISFVVADGYNINIQDIVIQCDSTCDIAHQYHLYFATHNIQCTLHNTHCL